MRLGVHLPNGPITAADWTALEQMRPTAVATMGQHHDAAVCERLEGISHPLFIARSNPDYGSALHAWSTLPLSACQQGRAFVRFGNEQNIEGLTAAEYTSRFIAAKLALRVPMLVTNLAFVTGWQQYLAGMARAIEVSDGIALSLYRDDASDPGRWLSGYAPYGKPLYAVELGVDYEREERRTAWTRWVLPTLEAAGVRAATVFILGGYPGGAWWDGWILSPVEIEGLAQLVSEQGGEVIPPVTEIDQNVLTAIMHRYWASYSALLAERDRHNTELSRLAAEMHKQIVDYKQAAGLQ